MNRISFSTIKATTVGGLAVLMVLAGVSVSNASDPRPPIPIALSKRNLPNGCLVDSVAFKDALEARDRLEKRWSRVLILGWQERNKVKGHALCVFEFNKTIWAYDPSTGTIPLTRDLSLKSNADKLARLWLGSNASRLMWSDFP
ncbi:MAG: hypothetical protein SNJ84_00435 [Verrucomicrobiia bacterium]